MQLRMSVRWGGVLLFVGALAQGPPASPAGAPAASTGAAVQLEVYYGTTCPNCQAALHQALVPLVDAGLPGDRVQLTLLPWPTQQVPPAGAYSAGFTDYFSEVAICVMKSAFPGPIPIDSPAMISAVKFLACDLDYTNAAFGSYGTASVHACADKAGIPWFGAGGAEPCKNGEAGLMESPAYAEKIRSAMGRHPLHAPFLFLNGEPLRCNGPAYCTAVWTPTGDRPLPRPGNLVDVICSTLNPAPAVCAARQAAGGPPGAPAYKNCQNCEEVGLFHWHRPHRAGPQLPAAVCAAIAASLVVGLFVFRQLRRRWGGEPSDQKDAEDPLVE